MGRNSRSRKMDGKVVSKDFDERPGWKGPAAVKKKIDPKKEKSAPVEEDPEPELGPTIPLELQRLLLNIIKNTFPHILASDNLKPLLQEVKSALYERDFERAFGTEEYLQVYSVRWSPSRALCYQSIFIDIQPHLAKIFLLCKMDRLSKSTDEPKATLKMTALGGGAAEVVAVGGFLRFLQDSVAHQDISDVSDQIENLEISERAEPNSEGSPRDALHSQVDETTKEAAPIIDLLLIDSARWGDVVQKLYEGLITLPPLSKYANTAAREANRALLASNDLRSTFEKENVLSMTQEQIATIAGGTPRLVTLLFTLNELYTTSISKTTAFLLKLTIAAQPGTLLLVVDSPGSYSETTVGTESKKYPMHWLLDHTLIETQKTRGQVISPEWVKLVSEDSKWFRIPDDLRYPIPLENMRYQIHLYRRI